MQGMKAAARLLGQSPFNLSWLGCIYAMTGRIEEARKILQQKQDLAQQARVAATSFARRIKRPKN
jgi:hypothetical protein